MPNYSAGPLRLLLIAYAFLVGMPAGVAAQQSSRVLPRNVADSSFAVRLQLSMLAEDIRQGTIRGADPQGRELSNAARDLSAVAARRTKHRPPRPGMGPLWDLVFDSVRVEVVSQDELRVRARMRLQTDSDEGSETILYFTRKAQRWGLVRSEGLMAGLRKLSTSRALGVQP